MGVFPVNGVVDFQIQTSLIIVPFQRTNIPFQLLPAEVSVAEDQMMTIGVVNSRQFPAEGFTVGFQVFSRHFHSHQIHTNLKIGRVHKEQHS